MTMQTSFPWPDRVPPCSGHAFELPNEDDTVSRLKKSKFSRAWDAPVKPAQDNVNHPAHYTQGGVECIDAILAATINKSGREGYLVGNIIKYLWRYEAKGGRESVLKAEFYLKRLLEEVK
jgi:hypothetical protein